MRGRLEAAPTTTGRTSTARWSGSGKQDRKAYVRNQCQKTPQYAHQLQPGGSGLDSSACPHCNMRATSRPDDVFGSKATVKVCGVVVAMLQGYSWAPTLSSGMRVNVGTILVVPPAARSWLSGGKALRQPMLLGRGGGPVVVRGRESRSHAPSNSAGEGVQRVRSINADQGGRR